MNKVFVIDGNKTPLTPCHPSRARKLLKNQKAAVFRMRPFTIILKRIVVQPVVSETIEFKVDPGSKTSGIVVTINQDVVFAINLTHHGQLIVNDLLSRRAIRRGRRNRNTRYRKPRFLNRKRANNWLPPSIQSRLDNIVSWFKRLKSWCPLSEIHIEHVNFDTQKMQNAEISGVEYQQGTLQGVEVRQYLLDKWERKCAYCSVSGVPLQIEHITPKSKGGTNRISNLTIACDSCNKKKGTLSIQEFLKGKPAVLKRILAQSIDSLKDAASVNAMKDKLFLTLSQFNLPTFKWSAALTKFNRQNNRFDKDHWIDAACVGESGENVNIQGVKPLLLKAMGRGNRQVTRVNKFGFPCAAPKKHKRIHGFSTGDLVKVIISKGKYVGNYISTIIGIRERGDLDFRAENQKITTSYKNFTLIQRGNGYA
jgi:5-methylcytosine-specific restriction endonuclease McrA